MVSFSHRTLTHALQRPGGDYAWMAPDVYSVVDELVEMNLAVIGGEAWLSDGQQVAGIISLQTGSSAVFHWETTNTAEPWHYFVCRCATEAKEAIRQLSNAIDHEAVIPEGFSIYFNLTWVDENERMPTRP